MARSIHKDELGGDCKGADKKVHLEAEDRPLVGAPRRDRFVRENGGGADAAV
jgi:hypothetical protein